MAGPGQVCVPAYSHNIGKGHLHMPQLWNMSASQTHIAKQQILITDQEDPSPESKPGICIRLPHVVMTAARHGVALCHSREAVLVDMHARVV